MSTEIATLFARIGADVSGLTNGLKASQMQMRGAASAFKQVGVEFDATAGRYRNSVTGEFVGANENATSSITRLGSALKNASDNLKSTGQTMQITGAAMTVGLTWPLVKMGEAAISATKDLDEQMRNIQSISRQTNGEIAAMSDTFVKMSTDLKMTTDSAKNLAAGFYQIQSSGFTGADGMKVLEASTKAATAGLTTTETSAKAILAALNAYGMGADDAAHISDVLFKTVDLGVLSFDELAGQIGDVMGTSSMANVSIEEVGAAISQMTRKGISGAESVTALNQLLLQFVSPSAKMQKTAESMGISLDVATLRTKGLAGALQEIVEKGGGSDALLEIFGDNVRALKGALALGGDGLGEFNDILTQFENVTGRTAEAFEIQTKSFAAQLKNLQNIGTAALMDLGDVLMPVLLDLAHAVIPMIAALKKANPEWVKWTLVLGGALAAAGPVLTILGTLMTTLGTLLTPMGMLVTIAGALGAAWVNSQGGLDKALGTLQALAKTVADMVMPRLNELWAWFASEVIPAVLTFRDEVLDAMRTASDVVMGVVMPKLNELKAWFETEIVPVVTAFSDKALGAMQGVSDWVTNTGLPKLNELKDWFGAGIIQAVTNFKDNALSAMQGVSDWITNTGLPKLDELKAWFKSDVIPAMIGFKDQALSAMQGISDWVVNTGLPKLNELKTWFETDGITALVGFKDKALNSIQWISDWITNTGLPKLNEFKAWFDAEIGPAMLNFKDQALSAMQGISDWVVNTGLPKVREFSEGLALKISGGTTTNPVQAIFDRLQEFANWVKTNWPLAEAVILTTGVVLKDIFNAAVKAVGGTIRTLQPLVEGLTSGLGDGAPILKSLTELWGALGELFNALLPLFGALKPILGVLANLLGGVLLAAIGMLVGAISGVVTALQAMAPWFIHVTVAVVTFVTDVVRLVTDFFATFNALFSGNFDEAIGHAQKFVADVVRMFIDLGMALLGVIGGALAGIVGLVSGFVIGVIGFFANLYDELVGHSIVPDMMEDIFDAVAGGLGEVVKVVGTKLAETAKAMWDGATAMAQDWGRKWGEMKTGLETRWTEMVSVATTKAGEVWAVLKTTLENLKAEWDAKWDGLVGKVREIWEGIQSALDVETLRDNFLVAATTLAEVGLAMVSNIEAGFKEAMTTLWATLTAAFDVEGLTTELGKTLKGFVDFGTVIVDNLIAGFVAAKTTLVEALTGLLSEALTGLFGVSSLTDLIGQLLGGGGNALNPMAQFGFAQPVPVGTGPSTSAGRGAQTVITDNRVYNITVNDRAAMALFLETQRREQVRLAEGLM